MYLLEGESKHLIEPSVLKDHNKAFMITDNNMNFNKR